MPRLPTDNGQFSTVENPAPPPTIQPLTSFNAQLQTLLLTIRGRCSDLRRRHDPMADFIADKLARESARLEMVYRGTDFSTAMGRNMLWHTYGKVMNSLYASWEALRRYEQDHVRNYTTPENVKPMGDQQDPDAPRRRRVPQPQTPTSLEPEVEEPKPKRRRTKP